MASSAEIATVLDNIELDYEQHGWEETDIVDRLDGGAIPSRVIATYWRMRANATLLLVNTSEAGSSRGLDSVYPRMASLAELWEGRADLLENPVSESATGRLSSFPIKRV